jgi:uncharacterized membrane protein YdbT with pleckstrin-like domain
MSKQPLLTDGEVIEFEFRPHWRGLILPVIILIALAFAGTWLFFWLGDAPGPLSWPVWRWLLVVAAVVIVIWRVVLPFIRWNTSRFTFTNRRVIVRHGSLRRTGRDMPLVKITDATFDESILGRLLNYGTLNITSASDEGELVIADVPNIQMVQRDLFELMQRTQGGAQHG